MEKHILKASPDIAFLSQWGQDLLDLLPSEGHYILNKVRAGSGGTTLYLESDFPCIIASPRSNVLESKHLQYPNTHLFKSKTDKRGPAVYKSELKDYLMMCHYKSPFPNVQKTMPKILVTVDSFKHVVEVLDKEKILGDFTVLVDEFQCLMSDANFKGGTDFEFLFNLRGVKSVCFLSATPIEEDYLDEIPNFEGLPYYQIEWDPSVLEKPNLDARPYKKNDSAKSLCQEIIKDYRRDGCFSRKIQDGAIVESKEVVIYLNDVRTITKVIEENNLPPNDVNVLCSESNDKVPALKKMGVHVGELCTDKENPVNRTFTFCTKASFEGVDMYSLSAFTYIFSDGVLKWSTHDLLIDVPQILGRQRLDKNPFRTDAILYYRNKSKAESQEEAAKRIQKKVDETLRKIKLYKNASKEYKKLLVDEIRKRDPKERYSEDYLEVVDNAFGGYDLQMNYLVKNVEIRDWQLAKFVYSHPIYLIRTLDRSISDHYAPRTDDSFKKDFSEASGFSAKMKLYARYRENHPEALEALYGNPFIEIKYHSYYETLGPSRLEALRFREKEIHSAYKDEEETSRIRTVVKNRFIPGQEYRLPKVKEMLKDIYMSLGIRKAAKAKDIRKYLDVTEKQLTTPGSGKREKYIKVK